jgi:transposase-like protein
MRTTKDDNRRAAVLRDLERSGLSMAEFCRRHGLAYSTVAAWRGARRRVAGRFVEVEMDEEPMSGAPGPQPDSQSMLCAELTLPGGAVLRVFSRGGKGGAS